MVDYTRYAAFPQFQVLNVLHNPAPRLETPATQGLAQVQTPLRPMQPLAEVTQGLNPVCDTRAYDKAMLPFVMAIQNRPALPPFQAAIVGSATDAGCLSRAQASGGTFYPNSYYSPPGNLGNPCCF